MTLFFSLSARLAPSGYSDLTTVDMNTREVTTHNQFVLKSLREGDLVEFPRERFSHWGVYVGNGEVVHLAVDENEDDGINAAHLTSFTGQSHENAVVRKDHFFEVAGYSPAKRNNDLDRNKQPLPPREIVSNALSCLGEGGYNVFKKNCQHFATWCRYGQASSDQVEFWWKVAAAVGVVAMVLFRR